jgi:DNA-binding response OmpR family regulator
LSNDWYETALAQCEEMRGKLGIIEQLIRDQARESNPMLGKIRWQNLIIDTRIPCVSIAEQSTALTYKEWQILRYLVINRNEWRNYTQIANHIWGDDLDGRGTSTTIKTYICQIRKKIRPLNIIETHSGCGYRCFLPDEEVQG